MNCESFPFHSYYLNNLFVLLPGVLFVLLQRVTRSSPTSNSSGGGSEKISKEIFGYRGELAPDRRAPYVTSTPREGNEICVAAAHLDLVDRGSVRSVEWRGGKKTVFVYR